VVYIWNLCYAWPNSLSDLRVIDKDVVALDVDERVLKTVNDRSTENDRKKTYFSEIGLMSPDVVEVWQVGFSPERPETSIL